MIRFCLFIIISLIVLSPGCICRPALSQVLFTPPLSDNSLLLIYTGSIKGWVEPCGCTADPLGGISRMVAVFRQAENAYGKRVVFADAGNLLFDMLPPLNDADLCQDEAKIDLLLSSLQNLGLVGTVPGIYDDSRGVDWRNDVFKKHNIKAIFNKSIIIERNNIKIGLIGFGLSTSKDIAATKSFLIKEIAKLKAQGALAIVALSQASKKLVQDVVAGTELDLVVLGLNPGELPLDPERPEEFGPIIVAAGEQGQYLGVVEFNFTGRELNKPFRLDDSVLKKQAQERLLKIRITSLVDKIDGEKKPEQLAFLKERLKKAQSELEASQKSLGRAMVDTPSILIHTIALERGIVPDPKTYEAFLAYEKSIPSLVSGCEKNIVCPEIPAGQAHYVGVESCKQCHEAAYKVWKNAIVTVAGRDLKGNLISKPSGHSKAWETLEKAEKTKDRTCVGCHTAGFMRPGGFCKVSDVKALHNVQCESCHGPGSLHAATGDKKLIKREVPESQCRTCHHVPHIESTESFMYEDKLKHILGPGHGEMLLKKLQHSSN